MPWKVDPVPEQRTALIHAVRTAGLLVAEAARRYGISRKTAHKWLARYDANPDTPPVDRSRRPVSSPARTLEPLEATVLEARDRWGWGPRKLHARLLAGGPDNVGEPGTTIPVGQASTCLHSEATAGRGLPHGSMGWPGTRERPFRRPVRAGCSDQPGLTAKTFTLAA